MYTPHSIPLQKQFYNNHWQSFSPKMKRDVSFSSQLNYEYWLLLEIDHSISSFCERPLQTKVLINKKTYNIKPDFWIDKSEESYFIFINYNQEVTQFPVIEQWCDIHTHRYKIIDKDIIRSNKNVLQIAKSILPYLRNYKEPIETDLHQLYKVLTCEKQPLLLLFNNLSIKIPIHRVKQLAYYLIINNTIYSNIQEANTLEELEVWV